MTSCIFLNIQRILFYTDTKIRLQLWKQDSATWGLKRAGSGLFAWGHFEKFQMAPSGRANHEALFLPVWSVSRGAKGRGLPSGSPPRTPLDHKHRTTYGDCQTWGFSGLPWQHRPTLSAAYQANESHSWNSKCFSSIHWETRKRSCCSSTVG